MDYNAQKQQHKRSKRRWNFIGLMLLLSWLPSPIGVGILIANRMDILPDIGGKADVQKTVDELTSELHGKPVNRPVAEVPEQKKRVSGMPLHGGLIAAIGGILAAACALPGLIMLAQFFTEGHALADLFVSLFFLSGAAGGVMMAISGKLRRRKKARFEAYLKLIGDKQTVPIHYLADVLGIDYKKVIKDLREMISRGILQPAWLDLKTYRLMLTEYTESQAVHPEEKKEEAVSRNDRILRQIRADNDLIADPEVSAKIDRIEDLTRKIFAILDQRPEKEAQLYNFMNYYLPTTLKALESYARLEAQGIETAAIREAKQKINSALDELADGYEKQLDKLFEDDVVDITADLDVMRKMLHKDGLKEDEIVTAV
ncbi:MAG: 5-bromo-4-chloroindolyl phosphate hydrolysis family protein, partial [Oscillospiraceae bacterium]|nr:5-bromo-4-chloroindolyl phosphate hydrolysis family protein [Oscillospiraceae bacterium]